MQEYKSKFYSILWYKSSHSVGIRRKFGDKTQIFSFGGKLCGKSEGALRKIGSWVIRRMDGGTSEAAAAVEAKDKVRI